MLLYWIVAMQIYAFSVPLKYTGLRNYVIYAVKVLIKLLSLISNLMIASNLIAISNSDI